MKEDVSRELLEAVDAYIEELFAPEESVGEALAAALEESRRAGLPGIQITPNQGRLFGLLAEITGARRILEIGTLGGYSAIHLAWALPADGVLISLEINDRHAEVARENVERAGLSQKIEVRVGDAGELLRALPADEPFDLVFIDADKEGYPKYLEEALRLSRTGSLILADNTIRGGGVLAPEDGSSRGVREYNRMVSQNERLSATILPFFKARVDGLTIARVRGSQGEL